MKPRNVRTLGSYRCRWPMVRRGAGWFSAPYANGFRRRVGACSGTSALTTCERLGVPVRGTDENLTPTSFPLRHTTSQSASRPSSSTINSKVLGTLTVPSTRKCAPVAERSRTVQGSAENRSLKAIVPDFRTRRRGWEQRASTCAGAEAFGAKATVSAIEAECDKACHRFRLRIVPSQNGPVMKGSVPSGANSRTVVSSLLEGSRRGFQMFAEDCALDVDGAGKAAFEPRICRSRRLPYYFDPKDMQRPEPGE